MLKQHATMIGTIVAYIYRSSTTGDNEALVSLDRRTTSEATIDEISTRTGMGTLPVSTHDGAMTTDQTGMAETSGNPNKGMATIIILIAEITTGETEPSRSVSSMSSTGELGTNREPLETKA